jgi:hypothetical protein
MPISGLPATAIRLIGRMVETGISQRAGMRMLRDAGFRFSNEAFRAVYNTFQLANVLSPGLQQISLELLPGPRQIVPLPDIMRLYRGNFVYLFDLSVRDIRTGATRTVVRKLASDTLISLGTALRRIRQEEEEKPEEERTSQIIEISPRVVYAKPDLYRELLEQ